MTKSKKAKAAAQEVHGQVESQEPNGESIPPTIVEAAQSEVFSEIQTDGQEVVNEQPAEKPAPKPKISKRPYIPFVAECLENGTYDRKTLLNVVLEKFSGVTKGGVSTFITDLRNSKYSHFKDRKVVLYGSQGKLIFEDKIPAEPEVQSDVVPEEKSNESPAE